MRTLISWFVDRPLVINLIMVMVFALGYMTIADMRYEYNPKVDMGVINITTVKAGAGPEEIELAITLPLEEELLEVEGIRKLYSNSIHRFLNDYSQTYQKEYAWNICLLGNYIKEE